MHKGNGVFREFPKDAVFLFFRLAQDAGDKERNFRSPKVKDYAL